MLRHLTFILLLLLAGCLGSAPGSDKHPGSDPVFFSAAVPSGQWVLAQMQVDDKESYGLDLLRNVSYGPVGARTSDDTQCSTFAVLDGWMDGYIGHQRSQGNTFVGTRQAGLDMWAGSQYVDQATFPGTSLLSNSNESERAGILVTNEATGLVTSDAHFQSDTPFTLDSGKYWCLASPTRFEGGTYRATPQMLDAEGLRWTAKFDRGILVRVESNFPDLQLKLSSGAREYPVDTDLSKGSGLDGTFCSREGGTWEVSVEQARSTSTEPWTFAIHVLDIDAPELPCSEGVWEPTHFATRPLFE